MFESESTLYWRRRGVAIASVVAVVLLLVWAMSGPSEPASDEQAAESLNTAGVALQAPAADEPVPPAGEPVAGSTQPAGVTGQPGAVVPGQSGGTVPGQPGALPSAGQPAAGQPGTLPAAGLPANGLPGATVPGQPGAVPANGLPAAGLPATGQPGTGQPGALPGTGQPGTLPGATRSGSLPAGGAQANSVNGLPANGARAAVPNVSSTGTSAYGAAPYGAAPYGGIGTQALPGTAAGQRATQLPAAGATQRPAEGSQGVRKRAAQPKPAQGTPPACPDKAISVQVQTDKATYKLGQKPRFELQVINIGSTPCTRDLDPGLQELVVTGGPNKSRVWSSNDCFPAKGKKVVLLQPNKPQVFPVEWAARTSSPGCAGERTDVKPGSYKLAGKLGGISSSSSADFTITP